MDLSAIRTTLEARRADLRLATAAVAAEKGALRRARARLNLALRARALAQRAASATQGRAHAGVAAVVSRCLGAAFGADAYGFRIDFPERRGRTEARLVFTLGGRDLEPREASSGGALDVAGFALRVARLVMARPAPRRLLCLDEPFKSLSRGHAPAARAMLLALARDLGMQFLLVTHDRELVCGKVIELG